VLLGIVSASHLLREFFLITTLSGRGASAFPVLVDAVLIWVSTVVTFAVWYWEIDGGGSDERTREIHASEDYLFPQIAQQDGEEAIGWAPGFLDYLFVSFTTSATFGPTDTPILVSKRQGPDGGSVYALVGGRHRARGVGRRHPLIGALQRTTRVCNPRA
jgi:hypothetical protein